MCDEVDKYIKHNLSRCIVNSTFWKDGKSRNYWHAYGSSIYFRKIRYGKRIKTQISMFTTTGLEIVGVFRKIPHRWLPQYNKAKSLKVNYYE